MKIAVISDTHMPKKAKTLPKALFDGIKDVDGIIHAGDWTSLDVYEELNEKAPVYGVFGNIDPQEVKDFFKEKIILELGGYRIGITHGHIGKKKTTRDRALETFQEEDLDVIIFGHSHIPVFEEYKDILLFNPGSPTDKRFQPSFSYGIMEINGNIGIQHYFFV